MHAHVVAVEFKIATYVFFQLIYPSKDEWIKKICYLHAMEHYSATKKYKFESYIGKDVI